jgi:hypothetical protein
VAKSEAIAMAPSVRDEAKQAMDWLVGKWQWPMAALFAAYMLLAMTPVWLHFTGIAMTLLLVQLPLYMVHQFEEHHNDRFRRYLNEKVAHCDALTPAGAFWINSLGVWGLDLVMIYLAVFVDMRFALAAFYLPLVNGLTHIRETVARREYNPGLCTSIVLFLPVAGLGLYEVSKASAATWGDHALGLGIAVAIHVAIIVYIVGRIRQLRSSAAVAA